MLGEPEVLPDVINPLTRSKTEIVKNQRLSENLSPRPAPSINQLLYNNI